MCFALYRLSAALMLFSLVLAPLRAETLNCIPVNSLPAVITTQGIHCLTGNLTTNISAGGTIALLINANNVTLDLNGFKVGGQAAGTATLATGIASSAANVTVRNGIVRGFNMGIRLGGRGAVVEDMLVDQSTRSGISVLGQGAIVRRNRVVDTGGQTAFADGAPATGIQAQGPGSLVQDNLVSGLTGTGMFGNEQGILIFGANSLAINNFVSDSVPPPQLLQVGINALIGADINILGNTVSNMGVCIRYSSGATGIFANNTVMGCGSNFQPGTPGQQGNNF